MRYDTQHIAPERTELDAAKLKLQHESEARLAAGAAALASRLNDYSAENDIKARSITDRGRVNVFKDREVLIITLEKNGQYSLQHQTKTGHSVRGSNVSPNEMTHERMMDVAMQWLRR